MTCAICGAWTNGRALCERHAPDLRISPQKEIAALKAELAFEKDCTVLARVMDERDSLKAECERMRCVVEKIPGLVCRQCAAGTPIIGTVNGADMHAGNCDGVWGGKPCKCSSTKCTAQEIRAALAPAQKPIREFKDMNDEEFNAFGLEQRCGKLVCGEEENNDGCVFVPCPKPPHHLEPCAPGKGSE